MTPPPVSVPRVAIRDLGDRGDKDEIRRVFAKFGSLKNVWVADNPPGFAYVFYYSFRDAEAAVRHMDGQKMCGVRVRVELTPIEDRRAAGRGGGFIGRGRGGYRSDSRGGPSGRSSYDSRDYSRGGRSGPSNFRDTSRSDHGDYAMERSEYPRSRERGGGRSNYDRTPSYGGRGRGRGGYSPRGHGFSRMGGASGYDSGYSEPKYRSPRGRVGDRGPNYESSRGSGYRGGGYRDREQHSSYEYGNNDYRTSSRTSEGYRGRGRGGGMSSRRQPPSPGDYEPRQRREPRREEHGQLREREKDYHSEYIYPAHEEAVTSRSKSSRSGDLEYREHRSRTGKEDYTHRDDSRRQPSGRMEYRRQSSSHSHEDLHEARTTEDYRERKSTKTYRKEEFQEPTDEWEGGGSSYRDRSPQLRSPSQHHRHHRHHRHYSERETSPVRKHGTDYIASSRSRSSSPSSPPLPPVSRYRRDFIPQEEFAEAGSGEELEPVHYEPVDQYIAGEEYRQDRRESRTPSVYDDRSYTPEGRRIEYGSESHPECEAVVAPYEGEEPKVEEIDRDAREVEYKEPPKEGDRYVKLEEAEESTRYEKHGKSRERGRRRRYSDDGRYPTRRGKSPIQRRHHSPSPPVRSVLSEHLRASYKSSSHKK